LDQPEAILDYQEQYDNSMRFYDGLDRQKNISQWTKNPGLPNTLMNNIGSRYCSPRLGNMQDKSCIGSGMLSGSISDELPPTN